MTEWLQSPLNVTATPCTTYIERAHCPRPECDGELHYTGLMWTTAPAGYHHKCNKCDHTVAIRAHKFPRHIQREDKARSFTESRHIT